MVFGQPQLQPRKGKNRIKEIWLGVGKKSSESVSCPLQACEFRPSHTEAPISADIRSGHQDSGHQRSKFRLGSAVSWFPSALSLVVFSWPVCWRRRRLFAHWRSLSPILCARVRLMEWQSQPPSGWKYGCLEESRITDQRARIKAALWHIQAGSPQRAFLSLRRLSFSLVLCTASVDATVRLVSCYVLTFSRERDGRQITQFLSVFLPLRPCGSPVVDPSRQMLKWN